MHGNFHQLRIAASQSQKAGIREPFKGKIFQVNLDDVTKSQNISEITELQIFKEQRLFSWFMDEHFRLWLAVDPKPYGKAYYTKLRDMCDGVIFA